VREHATVFGLPVFAVGGSAFLERGGTLDRHRVPQIRRLDVAVFVEQVANACGTPVAGVQAEGHDGTGQGLEEIDNQLSVGQRHDGHLDVGRWHHIGDVVGSALRDAGGSLLRSGRRTNSTWCQRRPRSLWSDRRTLFLD
jgi:hypothetical protein